MWCSAHAAEGSDARHASILPASILPASILPVVNVLAAYADVQQQQDPGSSRAAASSRWSSQAAMQPGRRQQQQPQAQQQPSSRQQGGSPADDEDAAAAAAAGGSGRPGFKSARAQLVTDLRKKGQHQQANMLSNQVCCLLQRALALLYRKLVTGF
jgi:hypothetical protein